MSHVFLGLQLLLKLLVLQLGVLFLTDEFLLLAV